MANDQIENNELFVGTDHYQKVTLFVKADTIGKLLRVAARDSRSLDHIINVALDGYVKTRRGAI